MYDIDTQLIFEAYKWSVVDDLEMLFHSFWNKHYQLNVPETIALAKKIDRKSLKEIFDKITPDSDDRHAAEEYYYVACDFLNDRGVGCYKYPEPDFSKLAMEFYRYMLSKNRKISNDTALDWFKVKYPI